MVESAQTNLVGPSETVLTSALPFAFAQSRGVLLEKSASLTTLYYVPPLATEVLLEPAPATTGTRPAACLTT